MSKYNEAGELGELENQPLTPEEQKAFDEMMAQADKEFEAAKIRGPFLAITQNWAKMLQQRLADKVPERGGWPDLLRWINGAKRKGDQEEHLERIAVGYYQLMEKVDKLGPLLVDLNGPELTKTLTDIGNHAMILEQMVCDENGYQQDSPAAQKLRLMGRVRQALEFDPELWRMKLKSPFPVKGLGIIQNLSSRKYTTEGTELKNEGDGDSV